MNDAVAMDSTTVPRAVNLAMELRRERKNA